MVVIDKYDCGCMNTVVVVINTLDTNNNSAEKPTFLNIIRQLIVFMIEICVDDNCTNDDCNINDEVILLVK